MRRETRDKKSSSSLRSPVSCFLFPVSLLQSWCVVAFTRADSEIGTGNA